MISMQGKPAVTQFVDDELDQGFWDAAARHEFAIQRCGLCARTFWPASACPDHGPAAMAWVPTAGTGTVVTFTVFHRAFHPAWAADLPYVVAVVALDAGPQVITNIVGCDPAEVRCEMPVEAVFEEAGPGFAIPRFRPQASS